MVLFISLFFYLFCSLLTTLRGKIYNIYCILQVKNSYKVKFLTNVLK